MVDVPVSWDNDGAGKKRAGEKVRVAESRCHLFEPNEALLVQISRTPQVSLSHIFQVRVISRANRNREGQ